MKKNKIVLMEDKLLKKEKYFKHVKRVSMELAIVIIFGVILFLFVNLEFLYEKITHIFIGFLFSIFWFWEAHLRIRHIDSIKYYRKISLDKDVCAKNKY